MDKFEEVFAKFSLNSSIKDYDGFKNDFKEAYESTILQVFNQKVKTLKVKSDVPSVQCEGVTKKGEQCRKKASEGDDGEVKMCKTHQKSNGSVSRGGNSKDVVLKCSGVTAKGVPCSNGGKTIPSESSSGNGYCFRHIKNWETYEEVDTDEE